MGWDSNPAKTHSLPTEITYLVSGPSEAQVLDVSLQNSVTDKLIGKNWIYLERNILQRQSVALTEGEGSGLKMWYGQLLWAG